MIGLPVVNEKHRKYHSDHPLSWIRCRWIILSTSDAKPTHEIRLPLCGTRPHLTLDAVPMWVGRVQHLFPTCVLLLGDLHPRHIYHIRWLSLLSPHEAALFFSFFVRCFLLHRYFDTRKLWWCMEAGAGGQIQYISRRKVCQYTENWTICEWISRIALYALIWCYMLLFRVISYSKNFLNYACFTFAPVWNIMGAYMIEV